MPMQLTGRSFRNFAGAVLAVLTLTIVSQAQDVASQKNSTVKIKNFGQMDERFYRGAQPKEQDYKDLAALGIKTVIDLQAEPKDYEKSMVESLGMKYVNIRQEVSDRRGNQDVLESRQRSGHWQIFRSLCRWQTSHGRHGRRLSLPVLRLEL